MAYRRYGGMGSTPNVAKSFGAGLSTHTVLPRRRRKMGGSPGVAVTLMPQAGPAGATAASSRLVVSQAVKRSNFF